MMRASALKKSGRTNKNENYPTPVSLVRKMVKQMLATSFMVEKEKYLPDVRVLDVCAGNGVWGIVTKQELEALGMKVHVTAIELDDTILPAPEVDEWITADFRSSTLEDLGTFDFILSNPPFSLVYELTAWAIDHLNPWGIFTLLIGSNFMFAETQLKKWLPTIRPILEIKWTRRPSFIHVFSKKAYGKEVKRTNAKDYTGYYFGGEALTNWLQRHDHASVYLNIQTDSTPWFTCTQLWDYESDPLQVVLEERPVSVQQALIREAAEAKLGTITFDFRAALLAVNHYGWSFYHAGTMERFDLLDQLFKEGKLGNKT